MKNKIISVLLLLVLSITTAFSAPTEIVRAAEAEEQLKVDLWAVPDIVTGSTYGIYPDQLFYTDLTKNVTLGKLYLMISGVRCKIIESGSATEKDELNLDLGYTITVEDVLNAFYTILTGYEYKTDIGLNSGQSGVEFMKQHGIYTGGNGEQAITDRCTYEQALVIATRLITYLYDTLGTAGKGFLWQVKARNNTVYLLGSIHMASYSIYPFSNTILQDFFNSDALIVEANLLDQVDLQAFSALVYYTDGTSLKDHLSADTYQRVVEAAAFMGLSEEITNYLKPWYLYLLFENYLASSSDSSSNQIAADLGIDMTLLNYATLYQKPVYAIEGLEGQAKILESFSAGLQEYLLSQDLDAMDALLRGEAATDTGEYIELLLQYWHDGNIEGFQELNQTDASSMDGLSDEELAYYNEYQEKFFAGRDQNMAEYIDRLLKSEGSNTYFVVVGSAHYISNYSVLDRLEEMGYEVKPVEQ